MAALVVPPFGTMADIGGGRSDYPSRRDQLKQEANREMQLYLAEQRTKNPRLRKSTNDELKVTFASSPSPPPPHPRGGGGGGGVDGGGLNVNHHHNNHQQQLRQHPPQPHSNPYYNPYTSYGPPSHSPTSQTIREQPPIWLQNQRPSTYPEFGTAFAQPQPPPPSMHSPILGASRLLAPSSWTSPPRNPLPLPDPYYASNLYPSQPPPLTTTGPYYDDFRYAAAPSHGSYAQPPSSRYAPPPLQQQQQQQQQLFPQQPQMDLNSHPSPYSPYGGPTQLHNSYTQSSQNGSPSIDNSKSYGDELRRQIEEDKQKKQQEKNIRRQPEVGMVQSFPDTHGQRSQLNNIQNQTSQQFQQQQQYQQNGNNSGNTGGRHRFTMGGENQQTLSQANMPYNTPDSNSKLNYLKELEYQIQEKKLKKEQYKAAQMEDEMRKMKEAENLWKSSDVQRPLEKSFAGRRRQPQIQAMQNGGGGAFPFQDQMNNNMGSTTMLNSSPSFDQFKSPEAFLENLRQLSFNNNNNVNIAQPDNNGGGMFSNTSSQIPPILSFLANNNSTANMMPPQFQMQSGSGGSTENLSKSFARGQLNLEQQPSWQREEALKKHRVQYETQNILKQQIAEKEAEKARQEAQQKLEEEREQLRLEKDQQILREKYQREIDEQKKKEEDARLENEKMKREKAVKQKEEEIRMERALQEAQDKAKREREKMRKERISEGGSSTDNLQSSEHVFRSNSPPIPTHRGKAGQGLGSDPAMTEYATPTQAANNIKNAHNNDTVASHAPARQIAVDHPPEHPKQINNPDTKAVLMQLSEIQRDLDLENQKLQSELNRSKHEEPFRKPTEKSRKPSSVTKDEQQPAITAAMKRNIASSTIQSSLINSIDYKPYRTRAIQASKDQADENEPTNNSILEKQRAVIARQEEELSVLRRVQNIPNEMESSAKEKKRRDQSVTESQKKVQKFLHGNVTSSSKNPQASDDSPVSIEKIRKDVETDQRLNSNSKLLYLDGKVTDQRAAKDSSSMAPANSSSSLGGFNQFPFFDDITRPRSREGDAGGVGSGAVAYGRRKSETRGSANELSQEYKKYRTNSAGTLNVDAIAAKNEERLKALAVMEFKEKRNDSSSNLPFLSSSSSTKPSVESNIILSFLQKEQRLKSIRSSSSTAIELPSISSFKDLGIGKAGLNIFPK